MKTIRLAGSIVVTVNALFATVTEAQVPANFPDFSVTTYSSNAVAPGFIFLSVTDPGTNGAFYMMILTNNGNPLWYQAATNEIWDFKPLPDGELHYGDLFHTYSYTGGGDVFHQLHSRDLRKQII